MCDKKGYRIKMLLLLCGVLFSLIFIMLGYWSAAILGFMMDSSVDFLTGFCMVMDKPFGKYFNDLTPVGMILGFIIAEGLFFFFLTRNREKEEILDEDDLEPDIIDVADKAGMDYIDTKKVLQPSDSELFSSKSVAKMPADDKSVDYVVPGENAKTADDKRKAEEMQENLSFDDEIVTDLLNDYDLAQIAAMVQIKKYIEIDNATLLRKMFKPSMSAEDITSYIKMFYE